MYEVGNRPHHYRAFMSLVAHWADWEKARAEYPKIDTPVLLVYGDHDWSRAKEREANHRAIPGSQMEIASDAGHFLSLDAPQPLIQLILSFNRDTRRGSGRNVLSAGAMRSGHSFISMMPQADLTRCVEKGMRRKFPVGETALDFIKQNDIIRTTV